MVNVGTIIATLGLNNAQFIAGLKQSEGALAASATKMASIGKTLTLGLTVPLVAVAAATTKVATDFNKSMAEISTLIPGATSRVNELKTGIQELAIETGKSTGDLAGGMYEIISAFGDAEDSMYKLELASKAAVAGISDTNSSVKLASAVMKAYGDTSAEAMSKVFDLSFQTVKLGQTTFPELASSIQKVTSSADFMGMSMEELFAMFATLTGVTGDAAAVSTGLTGVLSGLMKPTEQLKAVYAELGYESGEAMIQELGFIGTLKKLEAQTNGTSIGIAELFANQRALKTILPLLNSLSDDYTRKLGEMEDATGSMNEAYEEYISGNGELSHSFEQAQQMMVVFAQRLGDALAPAIQSLVRTLNNYLLPALLKMVDAFTKLPEGVQSAVLAIGVFAAALGPVLWIGAKVIVMAKGIGVALTALSGVVGALSGVGGMLGLEAASHSLAVALGGLGVSADAALAAVTAATIAIPIAIAAAYADLTKRGIGTSGEGWEDLPAETQMLQPGGATTGYGMPMETAEKTKTRLKTALIDPFFKATKRIFTIGDIIPDVKGMWDDLVSSAPKVNVLLELDNGEILKISTEVEEAVAELTVQLELDIKDLNKQTGAQLAEYTLGALDTLQGASENYREKFDIMTRGGSDFAKVLSKGIYNEEALKAIGLSDKEIEQFQNTQQYQTDSLQQYITIQQQATKLAKEFAEGKKLNEEQLNAVKDYYAEELSAASNYATSIQGLLATANASLAEIAAKDTTVNVTVNVSGTGGVTTEYSAGTGLGTVGYQEPKLEDEGTHDLLKAINHTLKTTVGATTTGTAGTTTLGDLKKVGFF